MVETLLDKAPAWIGGQGPEGDVALFSAGMLRRNLADLPFTGQCAPDELRAAQERITAALESEGFLRSGAFMPFDEALAPGERAFLTERGALPLAGAEQARGAYVSDDQSLAIAVHGQDHLTIMARRAGFDLDGVWRRLEEAEAALARSLDFAFDERLGYLAADTGAVGTGLTLSVVCHLPARAAFRGAGGDPAGPELESHHRVEAFTFHDGRKGAADGKGALFSIANAGTLGLSEVEIVFNLENVVNGIIEAERSARAAWLKEGRAGLDDQCGRALGVARGARLLEWSEAMGVLSALRLGCALNLLDHVSYEQLNEVTLAAQPGHLSVKLGTAAEEMAIGAERADVFRARFS